MIIRTHTLHRLHQIRGLEDVLSGIFWFETADRHSYFVSDVRLDKRGNFVSVKYLYISVSDERDFA